MTMTDVSPWRMRIWNARRGIARAADQLRSNMEDIANDDVVPVDSVLTPLLANLQAAIAEAREAEGVGTESP